MKWIITQTAEIANLCDYIFIPTGMVKQAKNNKMVQISLRRQNQNHHNNIQNKNTIKSLTRFHL